MYDLLKEEVYTDVTEMIEDYESEVENESNTLESVRPVLSGNDINNYYYNNFYKPLIFQSWIMLSLDR